MTKCSTTIWVSRPSIITSPTKPINLTLIRMSGNIGSFVGFLRKMYTTPLYYTVNKYVCCNELRYGTLVGRDKRGNEYYENNDYFLGR